MDGLKKASSLYMSSADLAELFNLGERRIQQLTGFDDDSVLIPTSKKKPFQYDLIPVTKSFIKYLQDQLTGKSARIKNSEKEGAKLDVDIELKNIKLKKSKLELDELEGNMHRSEDVQAMTEDLIYTIRNMLSAIPSRCSDDVAEMKDSRLISEYLRKEVNHILATLSNYQYDPREYQKRVRERGAKIEDEELDE